MTEASRPVRNSPLFDVAIDNVVSFSELGGVRVAERYTDGAARLTAARAIAGIADLAPWGRIKVTGRDRSSLLQRISTNDLSKLEVGRTVPTLFVTPKGRIVDRALVLDRGDSLLLITAPGGRERLAAWIRKYTLADDVQLTDITEETGALALTGVGSADIVRDVTGIGVRSIEPGRFVGLPVEEVDTVIAPFDGLPAAWLMLAEKPGFESVVARTIAAGAARGARPIGLAEAEVLRVEAGIPAEGRELTEERNPWEARCEDAFSLTKGCYTGQEVIARLDTYEKVQRRMVGLRLGVLAPPALPAELFAESPSGEERQAGEMTSAVMSDRFGETIGLAFVRLAYEAPGTPLRMGARRDAATVAALPFAD